MGGQPTGPAAPRGRSRTGPRTRCHLHRVSIDGARPWAHLSSRRRCQAVTSRRPRLGPGFTPGRSAQTLNDVLCPPATGMPISGNSVVIASISRITEWARREGRHTFRYGRIEEASPRGRSVMETTAAHAAGAVVGTGVRKDGAARRGRSDPTVPGVVRMPIDARPPHAGPGHRSPPQLRDARRLGRQDLLPHVGAERLRVGEE